MGHNHIPLGRIFGISIGLDYSWFVIFALLTWMLAVSYYPAEFPDWPPSLYWLMGAATALLLFASVLLHELGHSLVALRFKVPVRSITLFLFGGVSQIGSEPPSPAADFLIAAAGPAVSLALALLFHAARPLAAGAGPLEGLAEYLAYINMALFLFNLIPGYPLDGGRVFRALVWAVTKNMRRATQIAANAGRFFAFLFIFYGALRMFRGDFGGGLWIAFIGWFLESAASAQVRQAMFQGLLAGYKASQAMDTHCPSVPGSLTLQRLVDEHILGSSRRCFLVDQGNRTAGLVTLHRVREVPRPQWGTTSVAEVMLPLEKARNIGPDTGLWAALDQMNRNGVNQLLVTRGQEVLGMLRREDVITFLATLRDLGDKPD